VQSILKFGVYCPEGEHLTKPVLSANPAAPAVKREAEEGLGRSRRRGLYALNTPVQMQLSQQLIL
jgi:hypothetical protein